MIPVSNPQDLAAAIRNLRQQRGITQYQLAAMIDDTRPHVHSVETGRRRIGLPVALRYLNAFGYGLAIVPLIETAPETALSASVAAETPSAGVLGCAGGSEIESGASEAVAVCGHCGGPQRGYASLGDTPLCHPDTGLDCYRLVTVYGHGAPCITQPCYDPEPWALVEETRPKPPTLPDDSPEAQTARDELLGLARITELARVCGQVGRCRPHGIRWCGTCRPVVADSCTCTIAGPHPDCPVHHGRRARGPKPPPVGPGCVCDGSGRTCPRHGTVI